MFAFQLFFLIIICNLSIYNAANATKKTAMIRQCLCSELSECKIDVEFTALGCLDTCKNHIDEIGDSDGIKKCLLIEKPKMTSMMACVMDKIGKRYVKV
jgi:hypothetical protein